MRASVSSTGGVRPHDVAQDVRLTLDALEMRESFAVAVVDVKRAGERALLGVDVQRLPGANLFAQRLGAVLAAIDGGDLHPRRQPGGVGGRAVDDVGDGAVALEPHAEGET